MKRTFLCLALAWFAGASLASAQPTGSDVIASTTGRVVYRINPATGGVTTITSTLRTLGNMVCMANDNRDLVVGLASSPPELIQIDATTGVFKNTIQSGSMAYVDYFNPTGDGDFVVGANGDLLLVDGNGVGVTTIRTGFTGLQGVVQDLATGGYGACDLSTSTFYIVASDGTLLATYGQGVISGFSLTQDHRDGAFILGNGARGTVFSIQQNGQLTTISSSAGNANAIAFDRWSGTGEIAVGTSTVYKMDIQGTVFTAYTGVPSTNAGMCFENDRNLVAIRTAAPNQYQISIDVPTQPGRGYVLAMSISGFTPALPVGNRAVPLVFDDVFKLTAQGIFPWMTNNIGILSPSGRAVATLDLNFFGNALAGAPIWLAAITLDGASPFGIGVITKPIVVVLR